MPPGGLEKNVWKKLFCRLGVVAGWASVWERWWVYSGHSRNVLEAPAGREDVSKDRSFQYGRVDAAVGVYRGLGEDFRGQAPPRIEWRLRRPRFAFHQLG